MTTATLAIVRPEPPGHPGHVVLIAPLSALMETTLTWTDTVYHLPDTVMPCVTVLNAQHVALHLEGYCLDGRGFSVHFSLAHLRVIEQLAEQLRALVQAEQERTRLEEEDAFEY